MVRSLSVIENQLSGVKSAIEMWNTMLVEELHLDPSSSFVGAYRSELEELFTAQIRLNSEYKKSLTDRKKLSRQRNKRPLKTRPLVRQKEQRQ